VYEAIESGAWEVNVWPVCETYPCTKEQFKGAWEDRFTYEYVKEQYDSAEKEGKLKSFRQELMLRITSDESRLVQDEEIVWASRAEILRNKKNYNFYITTDFATSSKQTADFSVISVWAYDKDGNWTWVDGVCERQTMDKSVNQLFDFVVEYDPQGVGIEITGQQGGFIQWFMMEMEHRAIYFNITKLNGKLGIRPTTDKLSRFNLVVPLFKAKKIRFASELKKTKVLGIFIEQIALATVDGIKGKDDCIDTVSMLKLMNPYLPDAGGHSEPDHVPAADDHMWGANQLAQDELSAEGIDSYVV
jgi:phage terminase large subunit-like protein